MRVQHQRRRPSGFTLLELVVVVAVLVVLAGYVLPKLDFFMLKANKGVAASNMSGTSRFIQQYRVVNNVYPDFWDSLYQSGNTTALWAPGDPGNGVQGIDPQLTGGSAAGTVNGVTSVGGLPVESPHKLLPGTVQSADYARSLTRMGILHLVDANANPQTDGHVPGDQFDGTSTRILDTGSAVAILNAATVPNGATATTGTPDPDASSLLAHYYPRYQNYDNGTGIITDQYGVQKQVIVVGLGPQNQIIGQVLQSTPTYANTDHTQYYDRLLVVFEGYSDGTRANLVGVVGGDADLMSDEVGDYYLKQ